jgi:hypothetical protein
MMPNVLASMHLQGADYVAVLKEFVKAEAGKLDMEVSIGGA